ncbi:hypothetical protein ABPG75_013615 [Micractinium tetrahymenae]
MADVEALLPPLAAAPLPHDALPSLQHLLPTAQFGRLQMGDTPPPATVQQQQQQQPPSMAGRGLLDPDPDPEPAPPRLPVHMRQTASSRMHATVDPLSDSSAAIRALLRRGSGEGMRGLGGGGALPPLGAGATAAAAAAAAEHAGARHRAENVRDLVARKRHIFLAQMSLDTKHSEIAKLEQRAAQREEALVASEQALDEDSQRFEDYLKKNDANLQEALRRAEAEARVRSERAAEAKRVAGSIAALRSEMGKIEEQLQECQRYKSFLDSVTPAEWFESLAASRAAKKAQLRQAWEAQCADIAAQKVAAAAAKQRAEHGMQWARTQQQFERAERAHREAAAALREALAVQDPPAPDYSAVDAEDGGMHFTDTSQLLAVFSQLEGSNMFQIQTTQDAEAALEAARSAAEAAEAAAAAESASLSRQVAEREAAIAASRERCARLRATADGAAAAGGAAQGPAGTVSQQGSDTAGGTPDAMADAGASSGAGLSAALLERLGAAYEAAGFARDASATPLQMLQKVEGRLEELLAAVGPPGSPGALTAEAVEKAREKERRQAARAVKLAERQADHEARVARVLARAAAPKFQKTGKPPMVRSVLQQEERRRSGERKDGAGEEELAAYLALVDQALEV